MDPVELQQRLAQHRTIGGAPASELAWLVAHGTLRRIEKGGVVARRGEAMTELSIILSGHFAIYVDRGLGPRKVLEWRGGDAGGLLPYSRMTAVPGESKALETTEALMIDKVHLPELIRECPNVTAALVHVMVDRARAFTSSERQDEKMMSLGRISAGLAHELNNPASAAARSAQLLTEALNEAERASRMIGMACLTEAQFSLVEEMRKQCEHPAATPLSTMERADREEELAAWLDDHGISSEPAAALVDSVVTTEDLDRLAADLEGRGLEAAVRWIAACCATRALSSEIERATTRIHELVGAVKRFSYMDRHQAPEIVDLGLGLRDSVLLMRHKARGKSIEVAVDVPEGLPPVRAIGGDLNQIWTNLIDNAIDAVPEGGHVSVSVAGEVGSVVIRIVDDGPGIPNDIRDRIFDQFFTTKPVGQGTGLGLDTALKLARRNDGDIEVDSRPGRTEFRVIFPVAADTHGAP